MKIDNQETLKNEIVEKIAEEILQINYLTNDLTPLGLNRVKYDIKQILSNYIKKERILTLKID